ncbi:NFACT RNA binding domain-containing protein [Xanthovirga aplysinae]|uniref:NFACT RNA binding domain-containing protein n=1 Tax=Xanthovirga aplysinae TaxID=2529853 RepID=UPI0012BD30CA|nr:NFACT RNA binding domain-containing protein [Xanthovirga aplysinae]MTI29752.1 DUF814 domain-containing protein [Xanthovirga aplysinae]
MHTNYYFLRQFSAALESKIMGTELAVSFSQSKNELILGFEKGQEEVYIKAALNPDFCCLSLVNEFYRSRRNSVDLFKSAVGNVVVSVTQYLNERCFSIDLENDYQLLFKMHGNRSNIILFHRKIGVDLFKSKLGGDKQLKIQDQDREIDQSFGSFQQSSQNLSSLFPTFGPIVKKYLERKGLSQLSPEKQWELISEILEKLQNPVYYLCELDEKPVFSLLPIGEIIRQWDSPIEAINGFYAYYTKIYYLVKEKHAILRSLEKSRKRCENYLVKSEQKLEDLKKHSRNEELANIIMANLHQIHSGSAEVELFDFYRNEEVKIKLKKDQSPQKNAENYYRKGKNQKVEIENLQQNIKTKEEEILQIEEHFNAIKGIEEVRNLRKYITSHNLKQISSSQEKELPFRQFEAYGFVILVGKDGKNNDLLTLKYAHKNDLWLHAKDVAGSHVVIKQQAGQKFPKTVIERAAQLAAYYSKRKTDSLCPVLFTPKKFVRKTKSLPPGKVIVDKEEVILVEPKR